MPNENVMIDGRSGNYKWLLVGFLWMIGCLNYMDRQAIFSAFPLLKRELGMSDVQLGLLGSVFLWIYSGGSPIGGYLGDRFKRKNIILISLFIFSAATLATGLARTSTELIAFRGVLGASEALYLPSALALIADYHSGRTRSTAIGLHQTSLLAGGIIGAVFVGFMGQHYGWRNAFYVLGFFGVVITVLMMFLIKETTKGQADFSAIANAPACHCIRALGPHASLDSYNSYGTGHYVLWTLRLDDGMASDGVDALLSL